MWVWCGDKERCLGSYKECWLKHLVRLLLPVGNVLIVLVRADGHELLRRRTRRAATPRLGPASPGRPAWSTRRRAWRTTPSRRAQQLVFPVCWAGEQARNRRPPSTQVGGGERRYHVVITAQGAAVHWQSRVHYFWYSKARAQCEVDLGTECQMGGFTRLLHSGRPDDLMDEIPTHVVQPLEDKDNRGYVVLNRPYAFVQWLAAAVFPERYVLMCEPDHVWLRPMPNLMASDARPAAFPFFYIEPAKKDFRPITEKFTGPLTLRQAESIAPIGEGVGS